MSETPEFPVVEPSEPPEAAPVPVEDEYVPDKGLHGNADY